jgi:radical SAM protein with 4Fe4S-binding SPASM domain
MLCVRVGDLAIVPCHQVSYDKFLFGQYIVKNHKIIDTKAKNISFMSAWYKTNRTTKPKCDLCPLSPICLKGCFGT